MENIPITMLMGPWRRLEIILMEEKQVGGPFTVGEVGFMTRGIIKTIILMVNGPVILIMEKWNLRDILKTILKLENGNTITKKMEQF